MDEPASALDPIATTKIEELIQELKKDYTIVIVTHNMQQASRVSDHTAFFYIGRTDRVRRDPENLHQSQGKDRRKITSPGDLVDRDESVAAHPEEISTPRWNRCARMS